MAALIAKRGDFSLASASAVDRSDSSDSSDSSGLSPQFSPAPLPFAEEQLLASVCRGKTTALAPFSFPDTPIFFQHSLFFRREKSLGKGRGFCNG